MGSPSLAQTKCSDSTGLPMVWARRSPPGKVRRGCLLAVALACSRFWTCLTVHLLSADCASLFVGDLAPDVTDIILQVRLLAAGCGRASVPSLQAHSILLFQVSLALRRRLTGILPAVLP